MIYDLVASNDPILTKETEIFNFSSPQIDPTELFNNMKETMIKHNGLGLSACQCGINLNMFVFGDPKSPSSIRAIFNPKIVHSSDEQFYMEEGCLSFPNLFVRIKRPTKIRLRFADVSGKIDTKQYEGISARIIQHEVDHCNGIIFTTKANRIHLERGRRQKDARDRQNKKALVNGNI